MKFLLFSVFSFCLIIGISSCDQNNKEAQIAYHKKIYEHAIKYQDAVVARNSLFQLMAIDETNKSYLDSLVKIYFNYGNYPQTVLLANEMLETRPKDTTLLTYLAVSSQTLQRPEEALKAYQLLYEVNKDLTNMYQIAVQEATLGRLDEAATTINQIISNPSSANLTTVISWDRQSQKVNLRAAALNLNGFMALSAKNYEVAKQSFEQALQIQPDFALPQGNLELLKKQMETGGGQKENRK